MIYISLLLRTTCLWAVIVLPLFCQEQIQTRRIVSGRLTVQFQVSTLTNLIYHLDCLTGLAPGTSSQISQELWKTNGWLEAADRDQLKRWQDLGERYRIQAPFKQSGATSLGYTTGFNGIDLPEKIREAGFLSATINDYRSRLGLLMKPADVEVASRIVTYFIPKFRNWWSSKIQPKIPSIMMRIDNSFKQQHVDLYLNRLAGFYGASLCPEIPVYLNIIILPKNFGDIIRGKQIENHQIVEIREGDNPKQCLGLLVHEISHYLFSTVSDDRRKLLLQEFIDTKDLVAIPAYNMLDEVIATAIGNGALERRLRSASDFSSYFSRNLSFYRDSNIDAYAKALFPCVERHLDSGFTITDRIVVTEFLHAFHKAFDERGYAPHFLKIMGMAFDPKVWPVVQKLLELTNSTSRWEYPLDATAAIKLFQKNNLLSGAILLTVDQIDRLQAWGNELGSDAMKTITEESKKHKGIVYALRRNNNAFIFVFVAANNESLQGLLPDFCRFSPTENGVIVKYE